MSPVDTSRAAILRDLAPGWLLRERLAAVAVREALVAVEIAAEALKYAECDWTSITDKLGAASGALLAILGDLK